MKKIVISLGAVWLILALASISLGQQPARERPARPETAGPAGERQPAAQRQQAQRLQEQIDELRAAHDELMTQLRAIHQAAVKENATETAGQVQALISKRQETHQARLRLLEQQQLRLQRAGREGAQRPGRAGQEQPRGRQAPDFELNAFTGTSYKLSDYKDGIVVLEWFNFECPFSIYHYQTTATMVGLAQKYQGKGVTWLTINSTNHTTPQANQDFAKKFKLRHPILDDRTGVVGRKYGARTTPHMFIIDRGVIVYEGAIDNAPLGKTEPGAGKINYVDQALAELTAGKPVSTPSTVPHGCTVKYAGQ